MIVLDHITKDYAEGIWKTFRAVDDVSLTCEAGEIVGLLGPNGAGKTTLLRIIATALKPTRGSAAVLGFDSVRQPNEVRRNLGFISSNTSLYGRLTPRETFHFFAELFSISRSEAEARIDELTDEFRMADFLDRPCDKLSTGMKQKVNIARSIFHRPQAMVLDEPTLGLDVLTSRTIVQFIRRARSEGRALIFSSHIMPEVEALCDRIAIIHRGRLYFAGTAEELRRQYGEPMDDAFLRAVEEDSA